MLAADAGAAVANKNDACFVVLVAKDEASKDITEVRVTMDGKPLADRIDGAPVAISMGEHRFAFEATGFRRLETTVVARERNQKLRVVVYLNAVRTIVVAPASTVPPAASLPVEGSEPSSSGSSSPSSSPQWSLKRKVSLGLGGAGVAGLAVGTIWAIMSKTTYDHALMSECDGDSSLCSPQGIADGRRAHRQAAVATVGFVAAGVFLSAAAAVYFTAPKQDGLTVAPSVADHSGGLSVVGKW